MTHGLTHTHTNLSHLGFFNPAGPMMLRISTFGESAARLGLNKVFHPLSYREPDHPNDFRTLVLRPPRAPRHAETRHPWFRCFDLSNSQNGPIPGRGSCWFPLKTIEAGAPIPTFRTPHFAESGKAHSRWDSCYFSAGFQTHPHSRNHLAGCLGLIRGKSISGSLRQRPARPPALKRNEEATKSISRMLCWRANHQQNDGRGSKTCTPKLAHGVWEQRLKPA